MTRVISWIGVFYSALPEETTLENFNIQEYCSNKQNPIIVHDNHNIIQLYDFMNIYDILLNDTDRHKAQSLQYLKRRLIYASEKLNPMIQERNQVKRRIGEVRWTSNPAPKFDYAERRLKWEQDVRNISEAINILEGLDFLRLKFGNQK